MKSFADEFAALSKRMNTVHAECILAQTIHDDLAAQRDLLLMRNIDKLEAGVWDVEGGHVAITDCFGVLDVDYYENM